MHITPGQFPSSANLVNNASKAYGLKRIAPVQQPLPATPASFTLKPDSYEASSPAQKLVAGNVAGTVNFDASPRTNAASSSHVLQMYTRAADKIEAAVAVQVGRTLDVRG